MYCEWRWPGCAPLEVGRVLAESLLLLSEVTGVATGLAPGWPCRLVVPIGTLRHRAHERYHLLALLGGYIDDNSISGVRDDAFEC
jgi:hypothetical protein